MFTSQLNAEVNLNGFATIAGGFTTDKTETVETYNDEISFENDSLFGLQISSQLDDEFSFTAQMVSRGSHEWETNIEWAYLTYQANDNLRFQFGKQRGPYFMYTDFVDVGFAYHWISPPSGVYDLPIGTVTGLNAIYDSTIGEMNSTIQILLGNERADAKLNGELIPSEVSDLKLFSWTLNYGIFTFRTSRTTAVVSFTFEELNPLLDGFRNPQLAGVFPQLLNVADSLEYKEDETTFSEFGLKIEIDDFQLIGEFTELESADNFTGDQESYYISAVYRMGDVTVHITGGADETTNQLDVLQSIPVGISPSIDALYDAANLTLLSRVEKSSYYTVGIRWDVSSAAAFKIEYTELKDKVGSNDSGLFRFAISTYF